MEDDNSSFLYEVPGMDPLPGKRATDEQLLKWRKSVLALNSSRRFRYAADINKRKQDQERRKATFHSRALVIQAARRFIEGGIRRSSREGKQKDGEATPRKEEDFSDAKKGDFGVSDKQLARMLEQEDTTTLEKLGGPEGVAKALKVDPKKGVPDDDSDVKSRQEIFGSNTYPEKPTKGFLVFVWEALQDVTLIVLMVCACISLAVGIVTEGIESGWYDGAGILLSITLVVLVTSITDYQQSLQFQNLNKEKAKIYINVTRAGRRQKVLIFDLVVGDIVHLSIGDQVPADGIMIEGNSLTVDESQMTGESEPKKKSSEEPFLMSGCKVADGGGRMMIVAVGMNTEWGRLMSTLSSDDTEETPLQVRLNSVATMIGKLGLTVAVLVFFILIGKFLYKKNFDFSDWSGKDTLEVVDFFAIAVTIIVVSVPEGLPLAVTLTLAFAMHKMMEQKALVRHLSACETMGSATTICSDKTGTLTMNEMTVVKAWVAGKVHDDPAAAVKELPKDAFEILTESICNNTSGDIYVPEGGSDPEVSGSPTEAAILKFALAIKADFKAVRESGKQLKTEPFSSAKKRMGVLVEKDGRARAHWKGASEIVLGQCDRSVDKTGKPVKLTKETRDGLLKVIDDMAKSSLRTLAIAYREVSSPGGGDIPDDKLVCLAIVGIKDPPRPGVKESIKLCHKAGIIVRMVTGDNLTTAQAISKEIGILDHGGEVVEGPKFRNMSEEQMRDLVPRLRVMARSSPTDKNLLVKHLRANGEVVAATGDGTNDAPALHEADIGLAMGIAGTEVAKESADVVILDDNFSTIVNVAKWGRSVYANIQKFVQFQLTVNIVALALNFISAVITGQAPLTAVQLLWVNLIMDTLGALALATEPPTDELMTRAPVGRFSSLITNVMWRNIFGMALYQLAILLVLQFLGTKLLGLGKSEYDQLVLKTVIFNSFVLCQVFNEFNARHTERINIFRNLISNHVFLGVIAFTVVVQALLVQSGGFVGRIASTTPLSLKFWGLCVALGFLSMPIAAVLKCVPVPKKAIFARSKTVRSHDGGSEYHALPDGAHNGESSSA